MNNSPLSIIPTTTILSEENSPTLNSSASPSKHLSFPTSDFNNPDNIQILAEQPLNESDFFAALQEHQEEQALNTDLNREMLFSLLNMPDMMAIEHIYAQSNSPKSEVEKVINLFEATGAILCKRGLFGQGLFCFQKVSNLKKQHFSENAFDTASSLNSFGYVSFLKGNYPEAINLYKNALDIIESEIKKAKSQTMLDETEDERMLEQLSETYHFLGVLYGTLGNYIEAQRYLEEALSLRVRVFSENHHQVAETCSAISKLNVLRCSYPEALNFIQRALMIRVGIFGELHHKTLGTYSDIGLISVKMSNHDGVAEKLELALKSFENVHPEAHPETGRLCYAQGMIYKVQGDFKKAQESHLKGLGIRRKIYGEFHECIGESYHEIANTFLLQGKYKEAEEYCLKFQEVAMKIFGKEHPLTALADVNVKAAYIYLNRQELELGEEPENNQIRALLFEELDQIIKIQRDFLGEEHIDVCLSLVITGNAYRYTKKYIEGIKCYQRALDIAYNKQDYYVAAYVHRYLAFIFKMHGSPKESLNHSNKGLRLWSKLPSSSRAQAFADPDFFAHTVFNLNDVKSAEKYMKKAQQLVMASKNEEWMNFAKGAVKTFEKREAKNCLLMNNLF